MTSFLETQRLILKLPTLSDLEHLIALRSDPDVMKYIGDGTTHSREQVERFLNSTIPYQEKYGFGFCSVFEKETGEFVGQAGLFHKGFDETQPDFELAYRLHKKFWGKGYATELAKALIRWGFEHLSIDKIVAVAEPNNIGSQKVLKKVGFNFMGLIKWSNNMDVCYYEIYKNDAIELEPYDTSWPEKAAKEIEKLHAILPSVIDIQHVGSTAIPGMIAKPIIDIQIAVDTLPAIKQIAIDRLTAENYYYWDENPDPTRLFFAKGMPPYGEKRTFHIHIVELSSRHWLEKILFRDYLRTHRDAALEYEKIKQHLAKMHIYDREEYTNAKTTFIQEILNKAKEQVEVVSYSEKWPTLFKEEAARIQKALGDNCIMIHHVGSTAVPGLSAKPVIDIIPVVKDIVKVKEAVAAMAQLGYESRGEYGMLFRHFFIKNDTQRTFNVHVFEETNSEIDRHLKFRDWMRTHPEDKEAYQTLKLNLAQQFPDDIMGYCFGKDEFVENIDKKTGFDGLRVVEALKDQEWAAARYLRQKYFFDALSITDPYTWSFKNKHHAHLTLYKGTVIIGYAHIQYLENHHAILRMIVIDEGYRNQQIGSQFLKICERWLKQQEIKILYAESPPLAYSFYSRHGYADMPINHQEFVTNPRNIAIGKLL